MATIVNTIMFDFFNVLSMGIGGGFVATIYTKRERKIETLIAREAAPAAADKNMFVGVVGSITGVLSAAVPGEILGYWELHQKYGKLPWKRLFEPTIALCKGHRVSTYLASAIESKKNELKLPNANMDIFFNPETREPWKEHDIMTREKLGETLQKIANSDAGIIYDGGEVGQQLIADIEAMDGIMTLDDLKNYRYILLRYISNTFSIFIFLQSPLGIRKSCDCFTSEWSYFIYDTTSLQWSLVGLHHECHQGLVYRKTRYLLAASCGGL